MKLKSSGRSGLTWSPAPMSEHDARLPTSVCHIVANAIVLTFSLNPLTGVTGKEIGFCILFVILYLFGIMLGRWYGIAKPNQQLLKERFRSLKTRLKTETVGSRYPQTAAAIKELENFLDEAQGQFLDTRTQDGKWKSVKIGPLGRMFWGGANENAGWSAVHHVERELVAFLAPEERVFVRLQTVEQQLRQVNSRPALALAEVIRTTVDRQTATPIRRASFVQEAELLAAGIELVNADRDETFFSRSEWYSKAFWMTVAALLLIVCLTVAAGHAVLFLVGGAGGLLSRLNQTTFRAGHCAYP